MLKYKKFLWFRIKDGWRDGGKIGGEFSNDGWAVYYQACDLCNTRLRIGVWDKGGSFVYCPKCENIMKLDHEEV
jgi:hypothetical protein